MVHMYCNMLSGSVTSEVYVLITLQRIQGSFKAAASPWWRVQTSYVWRWLSTNHTS